jgi:hypothetical protein
MKMSKFVPGARRPALVITLDDAAMTAVDGGGGHSKSYSSRDYPPRRDYRPPPRESRPSAPDPRNGAPPTRHQNEWAPNGQSFSNVGPQTRDWILSQGRSYS